MSRRSLPPIVVVLALASAGCWSSHVVPPPPPEPTPCDVAPAPTCMHRDSPCDAASLVSAVCVGDVWQCPAGDAEYAPPWRDEATCVLDARAPAGDDVHEAPIPVPVDGRCDWAFQIDGTDLARVEHGAGCTEISGPTPLGVRGDGFSYLALEGSIVDGDGDVRLLARGWLWDASAPFGVRAVSEGFAHLDGDVITGPSTWFWDPSLDLADAALVDGDFVYAYGCPGTPHWLEEDCIVGRAPLASIDDAAAWQVLGTDGWGAGDPARVFGSGPHRGAVVRDPLGGFLHVYAIGFGRTLEVTHAPRPEGPWDTPHTLAPCELPADDMGAYCAGPGVHLELFDPMRPHELIVSYSVGTTSADGDARRAANPSAYTARVVRVAR